MPLFGPIVPWRYFTPVFQALDRVPPPLRARALAAAGVDPQDPPDPDAALGLEKLEALFETVAADPAHADFGFDAGLCLATQDHGPLLPALLRARTLEDRLRLQTRYFRLITPIFSWHFERLAQGANLVVRPAASIKPQVLPVFYEFYAAAHAHNISELLEPSGRQFRMTLPFAVPPHVARYRAIPRVRYRFSRVGLPELRVFYPEETLAVPLGGAATRGGDRRQLDRLQRQIARKARIGDWVRMMLSEAEACQPGADELAAVLSMSRRSFERTLQHEGLGFRALSKDVRHARASALLEDPAVPVSQIAYRLGYSDQAAFTRAFRALAGCSPSQFRQSRHEIPADCATARQRSDPGGSPLGPQRAVAQKTGETRPSTF